MVDKFIKCHGMIKDEMITNFRDAIKLDLRYYAFVDNGSSCTVNEIEVTTEPQIVLIQWKDEKTIVFQATSGQMLLDFWDGGKKVKEFKWDKEINISLLSVCLEYYTVLERLVKWTNFLDSR
uniref:Uncharacterized protein n=1 Tax=viral metagenome TaxID=1070528 RepID=A0A6C0JR67_9ZZZZ